MEVTGQTKIEFEKWYMDKYIKTFSVNYVIMVRDMYGGFLLGKLTAFYSSPLEMKYGVFVDYFDSIGIDLDVCRYTHRKKFSTCVDFSDSNTWTETRPEGRIIAVTKADEIRNKQLDEIQS